MNAKRQALKALPRIQALEEQRDASKAHLVDVVHDLEPDSLDQPLLTSDEAKHFDLLREDEEHRRAAEAVSKMTLSPSNRKRARETLAAFEEAEDGSIVGEQLLEELVAREVGVALELADVEDTLTSMLRSVQSSPETALVVVKTLKETLALSETVRRRMQNCLSAAATLRAQRELMAAQRGRLGV